MSRGENIFRRRDGRWEARYSKGYDARGKIRYGYCYGKTYREAKEKVTVCKAAVIRGTVPPTESRHRFAFFCDEWLKSRRAGIKESTYVKYETILRRHILPYFGACTPPELTNALVASFVDAMLTENTLSPKTVRDILAVLRSVLRYAAATAPGGFSPVEIHGPKCARAETRFLSRTEQEKLTAFLLSETDECKFGILLALSTGIRLGELCALRWECVSVADKTVRIAATMQRLRSVDGTGTKILIGAPKSDTSVRIIPLPEFIVSLCRAIQPKNSSAYVLTGTEKCMEPRTLQYRMEKYTRACGLEGVHFHTLRHTFATRAVEVGFDIKSLSEILGHSSTTVTLERYVHSSDERKRENMNKLTVFAPSDLGVTEKESLP